MISVGLAWQQQISANRREAVEEEHDAIVEKANAEDAAADKARLDGLDEAARFARDTFGHEFGDRIYPCLYHRAYPSAPLWPKANGECPKMLARFDAARRNR